MLDLSKISVVLPSLDPDEKLIRVVDGLLEHGFTDIILVNDGSKAENLHYFTDLAAQHPEIHLLHHEVNKGKGAALKNAFRYFLENRPEGCGVVTVDGDDQHHPEDTVRCCERMMQTGNIILGCRDFNQADVPARSSFGNKTTSLIFKIFVGMTISDTQTGLRAIPREQLKTIAQIAGDRFEYETNMLLAMKQNAMAYEEVKIRTVYIEENKSSHFRVIHDSWRIYKLILKHFFRYTLSSVACFVLDALGVFLLTKLLHGMLNDPLLGTVATVGARAASSLVNFFLNQKLVFQTNVSTGKAMLRYYALALPQLAVQALLDQGIYSLLSIGEEAAALRTLIHVLVMCVLFIVSYTIQQRWVFAPEKNKK